MTEFHCKTSTPIFGNSLKFASTLEVQMAVENLVEESQPNNLEANYAITHESFNSLRNFAGRKTNNQHPTCCPTIAIVWKQNRRTRAARWEDIQEASSAL